MSVCRRYCKDCWEEKVSNQCGSDDLLELLLVEGPLFFEEITDTMHPQSVTDAYKRLRISGVPIYRTRWNSGKRSRKESFAIYYLEGQEDMTVRRLEEKGFGGHEKFIRTIRGGD